MLYHNLTHRKANINDLPAIIALLLDDGLGKQREHLSKQVHYQKAFKQIDADPYQYLMVVEHDEAIVGTCHLSLMHSLTFAGSLRLQIEAVRVASGYRNQAIGTWMINAAIDYGKARGVKIVQLMCDKKRTKAKRFYEKIGFQAAHEGMKLFL